MKKLLLMLGTGIIFLQCHAESTTEKADTTVPRILIINSFDASEMKARKNKKDLFAELADSLKQYLRSEIAIFQKYETVTAKELMNDTAAYAINSLLQQYNCTRAVVIIKLNVYFEQMDVEVTKNDDGSKSREATYDICSDVQYMYYQDKATAQVFDKKKCDFFTKRNVASGILAAGPDVVGKSKFTFIAIRQNAALGANEMTYFLKKENNQ